MSLEHSEHDHRPQGAPRLSPPLGYALKIHNKKGRGMKRLFTVACLALALRASYAGPFVTSDGNGGLNVQSCMVKMNRFTKTVSNADCTSKHIQLRRRRQR